MGENERLALMVQQGDREAAGELWINVRRLVLKLQGKYLPLCHFCSVEPCDLEQEGYFAVLKAVQAFDPAKGYRFTSYLGWHVDSCTREALGLRGHATRPQNVKSLDEPLPGDDESFTLGDTIPDESAEAAFEQIQEDWQRSQLRAALEELWKVCCPITRPPCVPDSSRIGRFDLSRKKEVALLIISGSTSRKPCDIYANQNRRGSFVPFWRLVTVAGTALRSSEIAVISAKSKS